MWIGKKSPLTGKVNYMNIDVTQEQLDDYENSSKLIQDIMPNLTADEREFIMSGYTADDWAKIFPNEDDEIY